MVRKDRKFSKSREWLYNEYVVNNRSRKELAKECNVSLAGFKSVLIKYNIKKEVITIDKSTLEELIDKPLSVKEISKQLNCGISKIYSLMRKYNLKCKAESVKHSTYNSSKDELIVNMYLDGYSTYSIAKCLNTTHASIKAHLIKNSIPIRNIIEAHWVSNDKDIPKEFTSYEDMYNLYINQKLSKKELGKRFNCDPCVIGRVLRSFNIPIRGKSESKIGINTGNKHHNWKGGITSLYMRLREAFGVQLTSKVLKRDNYCCQLCGSKKNLHVHHKYPFKRIVEDIISENPEYTLPKNVNELYNIAVNDSRFTNLDNLITYCKDCHLYNIHKYHRTN